MPKYSSKKVFPYLVRLSPRFLLYSLTATIRKAKEKFLAKTTPEEIEKYRIQKIKTGQDTLEEIFNE